MRLFTELNNLTTVFMNSYDESAPAHHIAIKNAMLRAPFFLPDPETQTWTSVVR